MSSLEQIDLFFLAGLPRVGFPLFRTASTVDTIVAATESQNRMANAVETAKYSFLGNRKSRITESSSTAAEQSVHLHCRKKAVKL